MPNKGTPLPSEVVVEIRRQKKGRSFASIADEIEAVCKEQILESINCPFKKNSVVEALREIVSNDVPRLTKYYCPVVAYAKSKIEARRRQTEVDAVARADERSSVEMRGVKVDSRKSVVDLLDIYLQSRDSDEMHVRNATGKNGKIGSDERRNRLIIRAKQYAQDVHDSTCPEDPVAGEVKVRLLFHAIDDLLLAKQPDEQKRLKELEQVAHIAVEWTPPRNDGLLIRARKFEAQSFYVKHTDHGLSKSRDLYGKLVEDVKRSWTMLPKDTHSLDFLKYMMAYSQFGLREDLATAKASILSYVKNIEGTGSPLLCLKAPDVRRLFSSARPGGRVDHAG